jgi:Spy/CpxP family protein refolding chaperone
MKKVFVVMTLAVMMFFAGQAALADMRGCSIGGDNETSGAVTLNLEDKFAMKAHFISDNAQELGLTEDQLSKVRDIKMKAKKMIIMKEAEIDVIELDIKSGLWQDNVDSAAIGVLVAKKYEIEKQKALAIVEACLAIRNVLTKEQMSKLKAMCADKKNKMMGGMPRDPASPEMRK